MTERSSKLVSLLQLTVFARSNTGIVGSNTLQAWMSVCVYSVFLLPCVQAAALRRADLPSKESY
jgi:hypothetical protein